jgi:hypothetical protein
MWPIQRILNVTKKLNTAEHVHTILELRENLTQNTEVLRNVIEFVCLQV